MNTQQSVLTSVDRSETPIGRLNVHKITHDARNKMLYPSTKLGEVDGRELAFKMRIIRHNNCSPLTPILVSSLAVISKPLAEKKYGLNGWESFCNLLQMNANFPPT